VWVKRISKENIFNFIFQAEDNSLNEYLVSFKILYKYVQTQDFKQLVVLLIACVDIWMDTYSVFSVHSRLQFTISVAFVSIYVHIY
jgi:hypothetical protein